MNRPEAQQVLLLYRPGTAETGDPEMVEALELARRDPELGRWFEQHRAFQKAIKARFRQIEVPAHLRTSILAQSRVPKLAIPPQVWRRDPMRLAALAVTIALLLVLGGLWLKPRVPDRFANYQAKMVSDALRDYQMSIKTNVMALVRQDLAARGAPADYVVPKGLERLQLTGGGRLTWRDNPVAMVCFDRGDHQMLFLFVMNRSAVKDPPPPSARVAKVNEYLTASWTQGDKTYVLAGPEEADFVRKYLRQSPSGG